MQKWVGCDYTLHPHALIDPMPGATVYRHVLKGLEKRVPLAIRQSFVVRASTVEEKGISE